jgi:hypothetical protein
MAILQAIVMAATLLLISIAWSLTLELEADEQSR